VDKIINYKSGLLHYQIIGDGFPVIFIHGFAEDGSIWENQVNDLSKRFKLILVDLPGSGRSSFNLLVITIDDHADCIHFILEEERIGSSIIVGHSMGGYIALAFAEKYPEKLKAFGLFHSTAYPDSEEKKTARNKAIEFIQRNGSGEFLEQSIPNLFGARFKEQNEEIVIELIERYNNFNPDSLVSYYRAMMKRPDRTNVLKNAKQPVLFIIGENDNAVPLEHSLQQCHLPDLCYIHILENTAHMGMYEDRTRSNIILNEFLTQAK